jgi:hypothetical protein
MQIIAALRRLWEIVAINWLSGLLLLTELIINVTFTSIFVIVDKLIKYAYLIFYKSKETKVKDIIY